ncbi:winged helix-turn-helix transcriptional regulator [Aequorivita soesokkakensis]|nr:helix-turn-helix domain-containing protein [Aequorivita soesokkakensis]
MKKMEHKECMSALLPVRDTLDVIGGKWKILIIISLWEGNKHFREIERSIPKLSTKVLSKELKDLEENQLITRTVLNGFPVRTEYKPTKHSRTLEKVILELQHWGINHRKEMFGDRNEADNAIAVSG